MRYFMIKYDSFASLASSFNDQFIVLPLSRVSITSEEEIIFIASVGGTKKYQGYAHISSISPLDDGKSKISIVWDKRYPTGTPCTGAELSGRAMGVNFSQTQDLMNELDKGRTVNNSRNLQELDSKVGSALCKMISEDADLEWKKYEEMKASSVVTPFYQASTTNWPEFIQKVEEGMGTILFAGHVGSQCYNLNVAGSDIDMIVIAAAPTKSVLSFSPPPPTIKNPPTFQPDYTIHEVSHFLELLINGDTRMLEQLFQDNSQSVCRHALWDQLLSIRKQFLTVKAVQKYLDEAFGRKGLLQVEAMWKDMATKGKQGDKESQSKLMKKMYIMFRLLANAKQMVCDSELHLYLSGDSPERAFLLDIRAEKFDYSNLVERANAVKAELELLLQKNANKLPDVTQQATLDFCSDWLLRVRAECYSDVAVQLDPITAEEKVKLLFVAAYEPYANLPVYLSVYSTKAELLLLSPVRKVDVAQLEGQVQKLVSQIVNKDSNTNQHLEISKFCDLVASNGLKTAELLCTPKEHVLFTTPEWDHHIQLLRNSGSLSSVRLSRKCLEVARKLANGAFSSETEKYQFWRLATIISEHLQKRGQDISLPNSTLADFFKQDDFRGYATKFLSQAENLLSKLDQKEDVSKEQKESETNTNKSTLQIAAGTLSTCVYR